MYLKYAPIPYLKGKKVDVFHRGDDALIFSEWSQADSQIQFSALELEGEKNFSNTKLSCNGQIAVKEVLEFERNGRQVMRVTAIRDNEELMSWEILDDSKGDKYFRSANSSKLSAFRWPFYAYHSNRHIIVSPLSD